MEAIAFFLSTLDLAVVASSAPDKLYKQFFAVAIGVAVLLAMLGDLSLKDASTVGGVLIGLLMLAINWYYKHKTYQLLRGGKITRGEYESFNR